MYTGVSISEISVQYGREVSLTAEEELYGTEPMVRGEDVIPEEQIQKTTYEPNTEIVYRMISAKKTLFIQTDTAGTNGQGIRVWKPNNHQHGTCIIGAMMSPDDEHFETNIGFVFFSVKKDAIMNPTKYESWKEMNDHKFWKLTASNGYVCPGTAVTRRGLTPSLHEYCCFKEKYLTSDSKMMQAHKSEQSLGQYMKVFQMAQPNDDQINIIKTGHFTKKGSTSYMVIDDDDLVVKEDNFDYDPARPLDLVETSNIEEVVKGEINGKKFSFWKGSGDGLFSVGSTFKIGHTKPGTIIMLKPNKKFPDYDTLLRIPDSFDKVFTFGEHTVWTMICPAHYRALGVAVTQKDVIPTDVYCIRASFTDKALWNPALLVKPENTGFVKIFDLGYKYECQSLGTASAHEIGDHFNAHSNIFCLKSGVGNYRAEKPIAKAFMTNVIFDMENMITTREPGQLEVTTVQNRGGIPQTITREIEYTTTQSDSFSASRAIAIDVAVEITMKIPFTPVHVGVEGTVAAELSTEMGETRVSYNLKLAYSKAPKQGQIFRKRENFT